jgi:hypothetical protein
MRRTLRNQDTEVISVSIAVQRTGLSRRVVLECVERRWVVEPLTHQDLVDLRRIRRLQELGVNMPGIEIILHLRRRILELQAEVSRLERAWDWPDWTESDELWQRRLPWDAREG